MIIAVDGPAGSGKSTVSKLLAQRLGFLYIDTGAMYRALTLKILRQGVSLGDVDKILGIARQTTINLVNDKERGLRVFLDGEDVSLLIRKPDVTAYVSDVAKIGPVREIMVQLQRKLGRCQDSILDGRDIGTVVFPDADIKFYLDADFSVRVTRRYKELQQLKEPVSYQQVEEDLRRRDTIDSTRQVGPLKKAEDAVYLDTTQLGIEEVVTRLLDIVRARRPNLSDG